MAKKLEDRTPIGHGDTKWFVHDRFGMFIHWGLYAIPARGEWVMFHEKVPVSEYEKLKEVFRPEQYEPRSWARLAKSTGMKYMVLTTKHHDGFCLFDSKLTDYTSVRSAAGRDLVREYVEACRAEGLRVGFYHSVFDWHHPHFPWDKMPSMSPIEPDRARPDAKKYYAYMQGQVRELLTNYGPVDILWFDVPYGGVPAEPMGSMIRQLQPNILVNNRFDTLPEGGNWDVCRLGAIADFLTPEQYIPGKPLTVNGRPVPWETCNTLTGHAWGYNKYDQKFRSVEDFIVMTAKAASGGGNMLLNVGPRPDGTIQPEAVALLEGIGAWMKHYGDSIYGTMAGPCQVPYGVTTAKGKSLYLHVFEWPKNGRLPLPPIAANPRVATLGDGTALAIGKDFIAIPRQMPVKGDTIIILEYPSENSLTRKSPEAGAAAQATQPRHKVVKKPSKIDYLVARGKPPMLDGRIRPEEWRGAKVVRISDVDNFDEPVGRWTPVETGECSASMRMRHDGNTLYVGVEVVSASPRSKKPIWEGDSIECVFGANLSTEEIGYNRESFQVDIDVDGNVVAFNDQNAPGLVFRAVVARTPAGFSAVLALPFASLLKDPQDMDSAVTPDDVIEMNLVVDQAGPVPSWGKAQTRGGKEWWEVAPVPNIRHRVYWKGTSSEQRPLVNRHVWARVALEKK